MTRAGNTAGRVAVAVVIAAVIGSLATMARAQRFGDPVLVVTALVALTVAIGFAALLDAYTDLAYRFAEQRAAWADILAVAGTPSTNTSGSATADGAEPAGTSAPSRPVEAQPPCGVHSCGPLVIELDQVEDEFEFGVWRVWAPQAWGLPQGTPVLVTFVGRDDPVELVVVDWDDAGRPLVGRP